MKRNYVVIGNGFDLSMGIKSSYNHFLYDIIKHYNLKTNEEIYDFNNLFVREFHGRELNWSDFETIFETQMIEINESLEYSKHNQLKNYKVNKLNEDLKELEKLFYHYISKEYNEWKSKPNREDFKINPFYSKLFLDKKTHIITFNFTKVLDNIFEDNKIEDDRIYQLHGSLEDNNIIFGGGFTGSDGISKVSLEGSLTNDKLVRIKKDSLLFPGRQNLISEVNQAENNSFNLFILGHSIMGSDFIFLEPFFEKAEKIYMFYYNQDFSDKLQYFIKRLGREYAEKIYLVPFFDVLYTDDNNVVIKGLDEYHLVKEIFNFPVPLDDESSNIFKDIQVYNFSFMLQNIKQIKIVSMKELQKLLDIFEKISDEYIHFQDNFVINIAKVNDSTLLSKLFANPIYKKCLKQAIKISFNNCDFKWDDFYHAFMENELEELVLEDNRIFYKRDKNEFDVSRLPKLKELTFKKNDFLSLNEMDNKKQKLINFEIVLKNPLTYLYSITMLDNQGMRLGESLCNKGLNSKIVRIEIDSTVSQLCFPGVEYLEVYALGNAALPEIELNNMVSIVKLNDFDNDKLCISTLFNSNNNRLPELQEFEINNMPLKELHSNILCNIFDYSPVLRWNSKEILFSRILSDQIIGTKKNNLINLFDNLNDQMNDKKPSSEPTVQKKLTISNGEIQKISDKWNISYKDLEFFLKNYDHNVVISYQKGYRNLKKKENYRIYKQNGGEIESFIQYRNKVSKDLDSLVEHYFARETNN